MIIIVAPVSQFNARMSKAAEYHLIEELVAQSAIEAFGISILRWLARLDVAQSTWQSCAHANIALDVNSVPLSLTIDPAP
jgi:hypothetical protein